MRPPAQDAYLDQYEALRRPASFAMFKSRPKRLLRNLLFKLIGKVGTLRHKLEMGLSGIARRSAARVVAPA